MRWYGVNQAPDLSFDSHTLAYCLDGSSQGDVDLYVMINAFWEDLDFAIQEGRATEWRRIVDTSRPSPSDFCDPGGGQLLRQLILQSEGAVDGRSGEALRKARIRHLGSRKQRYAFQPSQLR